MRKLGIYAVIVVLVGVVSSCLDDDNNYNYKQINEMQGGALNFENFNLDYSVIEGEELVLAPTFKFTIDSITPDVSYEWYVRSCRQAKLVPLIHLKPKRVAHIK